MDTNPTLADSVETPDRYVYFGSPVKMLPGGKVGGYLVTFSGPNDPDLVDDFFTKETQFGPNRTPPLMYHHGLDSTIKTRIIGETEWKIDDVGVWVEAQLSMRDEYEREIKRMIEAGKLGWSSGAVGHTVEREPVGKSYHIKTWIIGEASLTPTPAEPRNSAIPVKSLLAPLKANLTENIERVHRAFYSGVMGDNDRGWVVEVHDDMVVAEYDGDFYKIRYTIDGEELSFAPFGEWERVNRKVEWERAKSLYQKTFLPNDTPDAEQAATAADESKQEPKEDNAKSKPETTEMEDNQNVQPEAAAAPAVDIQATINAAVAEAVKAFQASQTATKPDVKFQGSAPAIITDMSTHKYDRYSVEDLALTASVLKSSAHLPNTRGPSVDLYKAIAARLEGNEGDNETMRVAQAELKSFLGRNGIKANEIHQSTLAGGGDEWVGVAYSSNIWNVVRQEASIVGMLPSFEFPAGVESMVDPLESTDPTWYKVAQSSALSSNPGGIPTNTVTSSKLTTANKTFTLSKIGARSLWTGELAEDAVLPFANQLRAQFAASGAEHLESAFLDGDTETGATANINDIAGTPASTDYFLCFDGPRKLALVTNTANSRDAGVLTTEDFLETAKLMGTNGRNAIDKTKVKFIIDNSTHYKALQLADVKTRDVNSAATVESGNLIRVYGYDVMVSGHMCKPGGGLSNTAGKIDVDTPANNTKGQILAIRPDQWRFGYRRNMTLESTRVPAADATEIVAMMRFSYNYRDTEAAAISYNVTV